MPPSKWDEEDEGGSPPPVTLPRRSKFDDEEEEEVLDSWDADDSEEEREKTKAAEAEAAAKAAETKAKAAAKAQSDAAEKKSRTQRIEEHKEARRRQVDDAAWGDDGDEDEAERRARLRATEKESDLAHAADLFGEEATGGAGAGGAAAGQKKAAGAGPAVLDIGDVDMQKMKNRSVAPKSVVVNDPSNPTNAVDLSAMALFKPTTKDQFAKLTNTLVPLLTAQTKKPQYSLWAQEFIKQLVKDLPSGEIKKIASALTTASNEKMREEKAAEKGSKKSKAAKTKVSLSGNTRAVDTTNYEDDDGLDDGDFM